MSDKHGAPYVLVPAKRSFDVVPVTFDWHNYLIKQRFPGSSVLLNDVMRPRRKQATGLQYRCTTPGTTSRRPWQLFVWPMSVGGTITDGSVVWTAEPIDVTSLRTTIASQSVPAVTGLTIVSAGNLDYIYSFLVGGGANDARYEIKHRVVDANGEQKEGVALLPVRD